MDEYDDDHDDGITYDEDWLYVEDDCPLADDLAETQIADPGFAGTNYDIWYDHADYDLYMFWDDLEFGYDEYWDYGGIGIRTDGIKAGQKRKSTDTVKLASKRRKVSEIHRAVVVSTHDAQPTVRFLSHEERNQRTRDAVPILKKKTNFAFLPDWRTRFSDDRSTPPVSMPAEMRKAAESVDEDESGAETTERHGVLKDEDAMLDDEEDWASGDEDEGSPGLDPEALKAVLMQRLSEAGLSGVDDNAYLETISKMLSGDGAADDAVAELANSLLGKATDDGGEGVSGWLAGQGISLEASRDDDASSVATADLPDGPPSTLKRKLPVEESPADSAIQVASSGYNSAAKSGRRVKFDVPSSADSSQEKVNTAQNLNKDHPPQEDEIIVQPERKKEDSTAHPVSEKGTVNGDLEHTAEDGYDSDTIEVQPGPTTAKPARKGKSASPGYEPAEKPKSSPKRKSARKRKAVSDGEEDVESAPASKRTRAARAKARVAK